MAVAAAAKDRGDGCPSAFAASKMVAPQGGRFTTQFRTCHEFACINTIIFLHTHPSKRLLGDWWHMPSGHIKLYHAGFSALSHAGWHEHVES